ncbi:hypothetical protein GO003_008790 [Methylicorpusculum oleiharenae]|uniref:hypothetical protein n=1 Tax=Methylicorpusculum oleiharenae TaxID=1338687 RepID=UPI00135A235D|nr:hypothetical protein [Methylicorpusculum oleiharenae]MCD2450483.1 hypothetical protein [Methylicorpusculum oleiharenae]
MTLKNMGVLLSQKTPYRRSIFTSGVFFDLISLRWKTAMSPLLVFEYQSLFISFGPFYACNYDPVRTTGFTIANRQRPEVMIGPKDATSVYPTLRI